MNFEDIHSGMSVRVISGSGTFEESTFGYQDKPYKKSIGIKLVVVIPKNSFDRTTVNIEGNGRDHISPQYLEPWNDSEHWNGSKWVSKQENPNMHPIEFAYSVLDNIKTRLDFKEE